MTPDKPFPRAPKDEEEREACDGKHGACAAWNDDATAYCTRRPNHAGDHAAGDGAEVLARWPSIPRREPDFHLFVDQGCDVPTCGQCGEVQDRPQHFIPRSEPEAAPCLTQWGRSFCPQCGPDVRCDEDGCCATCGATATGNCADAMLADLDSLRAANARLAEEREQDNADNEKFVGKFLDVNAARLRALAERDAALKGKAEAERMHAQDRDFLRQLAEQSKNFAAGMREAEANYMAVCEAAGVYYEADHLLAPGPVEAVVAAIHELSQHAATLDDNWSRLHAAAMTPIRAAVRMSDATVPEIIGAIQALQAERDTARAALATAERERDILRVTCDAHIAVIECHESNIGRAPAGSHPDEQQPRGPTWHHERANWNAEVVSLRAALAASEQRAHTRAYELAALKSEIDLHASDWSPNERTLAAVMRAARSARFVAEQRAGEARRTAIEECAKVVSAILAHLEQVGLKPGFHELRVLRDAIAAIKALLPGPAATGEPGGGA